MADDDDDAAAAAPLRAPAPPLAVNDDADADDDSSDDDPYADNDDDDSDEDPFANLSRFQSDRRRKLLQQTKYYSDSDDDDNDDDDSDSGSKKPAAENNSIMSTSAEDATRNGLVEKPSSSSPTSAGNKRKSPSTNDNNNNGDTCCEVLSSTSSTLFSDDDLDIEIENITTKPTSTTTTSTRRSTRRSARLSGGDNDLPDPSVRAASNAALEEARRAREALKAAQLYKAKEEEEIEILSLPSSPPSSPPTMPFVTTTAAPPAPTVQYSGATLRLTFRYRHPTTKKDCSTNVKLKSDQPLQHAVEEFHMSFRGRLKIVSATFDGRKLDMCKSPTFYDMEDEDLVDVDVVIASVPAAAMTAAASTTSNARLQPSVTAPVAAAVAPIIYSGATLRLAFRYQHPTTKKDCSTNVKLKSDQPLQDAVNEFEEKHRASGGLRVASAIFDGRKLEMSKPPSFYDMEDEDLVDVTVVVASAPAAAATASTTSYARLPSSAVAPIYSGTTLRLAFRYQNPTTKNDCSTNVKIKSDQPLQDAVNQFEEKHRAIGGLRIASAIFDGRKLEMNKTPSFYDMEDEDLVDVSVMERNGAPPLPQSASLQGSVHATSNAAAVVMPRPAAIGGGGARSAQVIVRFRINNSTDIVSFTQGSHKMFALQMDLFCRSRNLKPEQCKWKFGRRALVPTTTPASLGYTSGEIIVDVDVSKSKVATSRAAMRAAKAITASGRGRRGRR